MKKGNKIDDNVVEILLGTSLISLNNFNGGMLLEKILVLSGFVILIVGIIRSILIYKKQNKKAMMVFLIIMGLVAVGVFLGLLYRLITA